MAILVMCGNSECGELFEVADEAAGTDVSCPACGHVQRAGSRSGMTETKAPAAPTGEQTAVPAGGPSDPVGAAEEIDPAPEPIPGGEESTTSGLLELAAMSPSPQIPHQEGPSASPPDWPAVARGGEDQAVPLELAEEDDEQLGGDGDRGRPTQQSQVMSSLLAEDSLGESDRSDRPATSEMEEALARKGVAVVVLGMGLVGMAAGVWAGLYLRPEATIVGAYMGAAIGWVAGFSLAFVLVSVIFDEPTTVRCSVCGNAFACGTVACDWCGSALSGAHMSPMAADGLRAGLYALTNTNSIYWTVMLVACQAALMTGAFQLLSAFPGVLEPWRVWLTGLWCLTGVLILAHCLRFLTSAVQATAYGSDTVPRLPRFWSLGNVLVAAKTALVVAVYVVPVVTLPLLPMALLAASGPSKAGPFNVFAAAKVAWKHTRDLALTWLLVLLWLAGLALAAILAAAVLYYLAALLRPQDSASRAVIAVILSAVSTGMIGSLACTFALAVARCIGLFGRYNAGSLLPPSAQFAAVRGRRDK